MVNIFENIPSASEEEFLEVLLTHQAGRVERIVSYGHVSPPGFWYDQTTDEYVMLLKGNARLQFLDEPNHTEMRAGDCLFIPAHKKHRVDWTDPDQESIWVAIHFDIEKPPLT